MKFRIFGVGKLDRTITCATFDLPNESNEHELHGRSFGVAAID